MNTIPSNCPCTARSDKRVPNSRLEIRVLLIILAVSISPTFAFCQSQSSSQPPQSPPPPQSQPQQKDDSKADAAKKSEKEKPKVKRVYTEEDLSNIRGGVSVVGDSNPAATDPAGKKGEAGRASAGVAPMSGQDEKYWRGKAKELLDEMTAIDKEIAKTKDEIKKYGADGFDAASKLGVIYIDNRASKVDQLQKRKSELEKKLDQLAEDGRKAGAASEWFR